MSNALCHQQLQHKAGLGVLEGSLPLLRFWGFFGNSSTQCPPERRLQSMLGMTSTISGAQPPRLKSKLTRVQKQTQRVRFELPKWSFAPDEQQCHGWLLSQSCPSVRTDSHPFSWAKFLLFLCLGRVTLSCWHPQALWLLQVLATEEPVASAQVARRQFNVFL